MEWIAHLESLDLVASSQFIVVGSQRMGLTRSRALQRVMRRSASIQIQGSLFSSSSPQPSLILNLKDKLRRLELNRMNLVFINSFHVDILSI